MTKEDKVEGQWVYIEVGAGGHGMHPLNTGKIFIAKRIVTFTSFRTETYLESYRFSNPNSVECKGHYHDPEEPIQTCLLKHCRFATKEEIRKLRENPSK